MKTTKNHQKNDDVPSRQLTDFESEAIPAGIMLQPYDTEVNLSFFLGANYWNSMSIEERRALGREFSRLVSLGHFPGIARVRRVSPRRYYRVP